MPAINFKARYASGVEEGTINMAIRRMNGVRESTFKQGCTLYLYENQRTKQSRLLLSTCMNYIDTFIIKNGEMWLGYTRITDREILQSIAEHTGYPSWEVMKRYFSFHFGKTFRGTIIQW